MCAKYTAVLIAVSEKLTRFPSFPDFLSTCLHQEYLPCHKMRSTLQRRTEYLGVYHLLLRSESLLFLSTGGKQAYVKLGLNACTQRSDFERQGSLRCSLMNIVDVNISID